MAKSILDFAAEELGQDNSNDAPARDSAASPSGGTPREFVQAYAPLARKVGDELGVAPEVLLGQWGLETRWGRSVIPGTNNLGNIKDFSGDGVKARDNMTGSTDGYRKFKDADEFGSHFVSLLNNPRYAGALDSGQDAGVYFSGLKRGGYAEDPAYVQKGVQAARMAAGFMGATAPARKSGHYYEGPSTRQVTGEGPVEGATIVDGGKKLASSLVRGVGMLGQGVGEVTAYGMNKLTGSEDYEGFNPLEGAASGIENTMTEGGKRAAADTFKGNVLEPSTWQAPDTGAGLAMQVIDGLGNIGSFFVTNALTGGLATMAKARNLAIGLEQANAALKAAQVAGDAAAIAKATQVAAGIAKQYTVASRLVTAQQMAVGAGMSLGDGANDARDYAAQRVASLKHEELMEVPAYRESFEKTGSEDQARKAVANSAAMLGGILAAGPGALGARLSGKVFEDILAKKAAPALLGGALKSRAARFAVEGGLVGAGESVGEAAEKMGSNAGGNIATGQDWDQDVGRDTLAEAVGGFIGGHATGGFHAAVSPHAPARKGPAPNPPVAPVAPSGPLGRAAGASNPAPAAPAGEAPAAPRVSTAKSLMPEAAVWNSIPQDDRTEILRLSAMVDDPRSTPAVREHALDLARQIVGSYVAGSMEATGPTESASLLDGYEQPEEQAPGQVPPSVSTSPAGQSANDSANARLQMLEEEDGQAGEPEKQLTPKEQSVNTTAASAANASADARLASLLDEEAATDSVTAPPVATEKVAADADSTGAKDDFEPDYREVTVPRPTKIPEGPGTAQMRLMRAHLSSMMDNGFDSVERQIDGLVRLVNHASGEFVTLKTMGEAQMARSMAEQRLNALAHEAATSPKNEKADPTEGQKKAGNYAKGHATRYGMPIAIENPQGSERSGVSPEGKAWSNTMSHHYGYFKGTMGADGDQVDAYFGPSDRVFVIDQIDPKTGKFDEHKVMAGFRNEEEARAAYLSNFDKGWQGLGAITEMTPAKLRSWVKSGATQVPVSPTIKSSHLGGSNGQTTESASAGVAGSQDQSGGAAQSGDRGGRANGLVQEGVDRSGDAAGAAEVGSAEAALATAQPAKTAPISALKHIIGFLSSGKKPVGVHAYQGELPLAHRVASAIARMLGKTYTAVEQESGDVNDMPNGLVNELGGNHIFVDVNANDAPLLVMVHEAYHGLPHAIRQKLNAALIKLFRDDMRGEFAQQFDYTKLSPESLDEEIGAFMAQAIASRHDFWEKLRDSMGSGDFAEVARHLIQAFNHLLGGIKNAYGQDFLDKYVTDVSAARDLLVEAYADALRASANPESSASTPMASNKAGQDPAVGDRTDVSKLPQGREIPDSVAVGGLESSFEMARSKSFARGRDLKVEIQGAVQAAARAARVNLEVRTKSLHKFLASMVVKDAHYALQSNENAIGWYDSKISRAIGALSVVHPEINTDPTSRLAFLWALAVTSNGLKVGKNFEIAEAAYNQWKQSAVDVRDRTMPSSVGIGNAASQINDGLRAFNDLSKKMGHDRLAKYMATEFPAGDITRMLGIQPSGEWASTPVRGAAILGPKIGNGFFMNLNGYFDALTMDRWLMRTFGRMTGTLLEVDPKTVAKKQDDLKGAIANMGAKDRQAMAKLIGHRVATSMTKAELESVANAVDKTSMKKDKRELMQANDLTNQFRLKARGLKVALDGQKEAPSGPAERNWIRAIFASALDQLHADGKGMTMSDLQALLWYPERRLYDSAKSSEDTNEGYEDDEAPDYANAAYALALAAGADRATVLAAMDKAEQAGTVRAEPMTEAEKSALQGEFRAAPDQAYQLAFEVAPDPADHAAVDAWMQLDRKERTEITASVKKEILPELFDLLGLDVAKVTGSLGGFAGFVNPNLLAEYKPTKVSLKQARGLAAAIGSVLDQDSVAMVDGRSNKTAGLIRVTFSGKVDKHANTIFDAIRSAIPEVDAFTARGNNFDILNFTGMSNEELESGIKSVLDDLDIPLEYVSSFGDSKSELVEKDSYEGHITGLRPGSGQEISGGVRRLRDHARALVARGISERGAGGGVQPVRGLAAAGESARGEPGSGPRLSSKSRSTEGAADLRAERAGDGSGWPAGGRIARGEVPSPERAAEKAKQLTPLPGAPNVPGFHGPDPRLVSVAEQYARENGIDLECQAEYVKSLT
jgi:hypothetical protein